MDDNIINEQARNLTKAIFTHESNMDYGAKGDNNTSSGAGQWQEGTWKEHARLVLGNPNAPMSKENQSVVAQGMMRKFIKEGKNAAQIAAIWNSGSDKNWETKVGTKTYPDGKKIAYNVPKYVKEVTDLYQNFKGKSARTETYNKTVPQGGASGATLATAADVNVPDTLGGKLQKDWQYAMGTQEKPNQGLGAVIGGGMQTILGSKEQPQDYTGVDLNPLEKLSTGLNKATGGRLEGLANIGLGLSDVAGAAGGAVGDITGAAISKIAPQWLKDAGSKVLESVFKVPVVQEALGKFNKMAQENPELTRGAGNAFNIYTSLIPAVKTLQAAKNLIIGGVSSEVAKSQAGQAIINDAKKNGVDAFNGVKTMMDKTPQSLWNKTVKAFTGSSEGKVPITELQKLGDTMIKSQTKNITSALQSSGLKANLSDIADQAIQLAKTAFQGDGGVVKELTKAFGVSLNQAHDIPMARLFQYAYSEGANPYVKQVIETTLSQMATQQGLQAVIKSQLKILELQAGQNLLNEFAKIVPGNAVRDVTRKVVGNALTGAGAIAGNAVLPCAGGYVGGAVIGNAVGGLSSKMIPPNLPGYLAQSTLGGGTLPNLAKLSAGGVISNTKR